MVEDATPKQVWQMLGTDAQARLVDVRTDAEWGYVGLPDLAPLRQEPVLIPWQLFPGGQLNGGFLEALRAAGLGPEHTLYFLCRSGVRSLAAARAAEAAGFARVFNVVGGFEGPHDAEGHRGRVAGWKAEGLPWRQG